MVFRLLMAQREPHHCFLHFTRPPTVEKNLEKLFAVLVRHRRHRKEDVIQKAV